MPYQDVFAGQYAEQSWWQNHFQILRAFADGVVQVSRFQEIVGISTIHGKINEILEETPHGIGCIYHILNNFYQNCLKFSR